MGRKRASRLERNILILQALQGGGPAQRKRILQTANKDLLKSVCDCAQNVLCGNIALTEAQNKSISKHRKLLREVAYNDIDLETKRRKYFTNQKGGFLTALLPALLAPVLSAVVGEIFKKK